MSGHTNEMPFENLLALRKTSNMPDAKQRIASFPLGNMPVDVYDSATQLFTTKVRPVRGELLELKDGSIELFTHAGVGSKYGRVAMSPDGWRTLAQVLIKELP